MDLSNFRIRFIVAEEYQSPKVVPWWLWMVLAFALAFQITFKHNHPPTQAKAENLNNPPPELALDAAAFGDHPTLAKALTIWLQSFDNQEGISVPFRNLDYNVVASWLDSILTLDPRAEYPLFNASRTYSFVRNEPERVRIMLEFIRAKFLEDPATRWEWMSTAVTLAKHDLEDVDYAFVLAQELRVNTQDFDHVPSWAKQIEFTIRLDKSEFDDAVTLLQNLVEDDQITDPREFRLLFERLEALFRDMIDQGKIPSTDAYDVMESRIEKLRRTYVEKQGEQISN